MTIVYTTDIREDPDRGRAATGPLDGEGCDHERTMYVENGAGGSLTCQDCGTVIPDDDQGDSGPGISATCRWVLTRDGGRY